MAICDLRAAAARICKRKKKKKENRKRRTDFMRELLFLVDINLYKLAYTHTRARVRERERNTFYLIYIS